MRRLIAFLLAIVCAFSLFSCSEKKTEEELREEIRKELEEEQEKEEERNEETAEDVTVVFRKLSGQAIQGNVSYEDLFKYKLDEVSDRDLTVFDAVDKSLKHFEEDFDFAVDGKTLTEALGYEEYEEIDAEVGRFGYWECTLNGESAHGKTPIKSGDEIVYTWREEVMMREDTDAPPNTGIGSPSGEVGCREGCIIYSEELTVVGEDGRTVDPASIGKAAVFFWGTWNSISMPELSYFNEIATKYKDEITVIAVSPSPLDTQETVEKFIEANYPESDIIFTMSSSQYPNELEISGYPTCFFLNDDGIIIHVKEGASDGYDDFRALIQMCLES
ncbi:MAG: TlpA family protein disulfide reductase [Clostridia bacterium]|nr:TlpA family protein disulfide reductase [Clostridia bacterium]